MTILDESIQDQEQMVCEPQVNPEWAARMEMEERLQKENMQIQSEMNLKHQKTHARQNAIMVVTESHKESGYPVVREEMAEYIVKEAEIIYQFLIKDL